jgi:hypothetical protein
MRLKVFLALLAMSPLYASEVVDRNNQPIDHLASPVAEPAENAAGYGSYNVEAEDTPTPEDIGPVQKKFALATQADDLMNDPNAPIGNTVPNEVIALDKQIKIPVVHDVQDDNSYHGGNNDSILYEVKYLNWGAVTSSQLRARQGHYFTVTFVNHGPAADFTTLFEYRQVKSKQVVRTLVQEKKHVSGAARAYFAVVNHAYIAYGPVSSWRFTVRHGNTVVAEAKSYLW